MDTAFDMLKNKGINDVGSIIKWLQSANLIDKSKPTEDMVRAIFNEVTADKNKVELDKFKEALGKIALAQGKNTAEITEGLLGKGAAWLSKNVQVRIGHSSSSSSTTSRSSSSH